MVPDIVFKLGSVTEFVIVAISLGFYAEGW
jgi:hypothetical protein